MALVLLVPVASAHGYMRDAAPPANARLLAAPVEVVLQMSEPVLLASTEIRVLDRNGTDHARGATFLKDGDSTRPARAVSLPGNGSYVVIWSALWVSDGHLTHGGYGFVLGNGTVVAPDLPAASQEAGPDAPVRGAGYAALALTLGPLAYLFLVWRPLEGGGHRRLERLAAGAAAVGAVVAVLHLAVGAGIAGLGLADYAATRLGQLALLRAALSAAAATLILAARPGAALAATAVAGFTFPATSHAWATSEILPVAADYVHLLAAGAWVGGLVALLVALPRTDRGGPAALRFSGLALLAVAAVVLSGAALGLRYVGSVERLLTTQYGNVLLAKLALVGVMLALGALHRYVLVPALSGTNPPLPLRRPLLRVRSPDRYLRRAVAVETAVGVVVLALAGLLSATGFDEPPPPGGPFEGNALSENGKTRRADGMMVAFRLAPAEVGLNTANVTLTHAEGGAPVTTAKRVQLFLNKLHEDGSRNTSVPVQAVDLDDRGAGKYTGNVTFGLPGPWKVTVAVQRTDAFDDAAAFEVRIR